MNILLTNDDGIRSEPLWLLRAHLACHHRVTVVAPDRERSAVSHGITLQRPLRAEKVTLGDGACGFAVDGTPADCVKLALLELMDDRPDLVIAGINPGVNLGVNIYYSGTVAAAREAALAGIAAISVSVAGRGSGRYADAARLMLSLAALVERNGLPYGTFLNVNIPDAAVGEMAGVVCSRLGIQRIDESIDRRVDPRDRPYYWQGPDNQRFENSPDVDGTAFENSFISITPVKCDMTDYPTMQTLQDWKIEIPGSGKSQLIITTSPNREKDKMSVARGLESETRG